MYVSKLVMEALPNIHLLAMFVIVYTVIFRAKALIPIYIFIFLTGLFGGFSLWWMPYLYIWLPLWGVVMILPDMKKTVAAAVYAVCGAMHGFLYGTMYAPIQALMFGLDLDGMTAWIVAGIPFDITHGVGNLAACLLCIPLLDVMKKGLKSIKYQ